MTPRAGEALDAVVRHERSRCLATLVRLLGDIDAAEDAFQEAVSRALTTWPSTGVPDRPGAWLTTVASNVGRDRRRRDRRGLELERLAGIGSAADHIVRSVPGPERDDEEVGPVPDDQLRLFFTCCHPSLAPSARVALTLRLFGGLSTAEVARAFLSTPTAMQRRLTRAKHKIAAAVVPYRVPTAAELPRRLPSVLAVVYLIHSTGSDARPGNPEGDALRREGVRLARLLAALMPGEEEVVGLLALLELTDARRPGRFDADGGLVLLADQDRSSWDQGLIDHGHALVRWCLARDLPGPYQLQAAVGAVHCDAPSVRDTAWDQVVALYDQLLARTGSPVVALNRAVAVAELAGPAHGLALTDGLHHDLDRYAPFHAVRAHLQRQLGRTRQAHDSDRRAAALDSAPALVDHLSALAATPNDV